MINQHPAKGFTLIEMLIYMGLFAMFMSSIVAGAYPLVVGTEHSMVRANSDIESAFLTQKIIGALSTGSGVTSPSAGASSASLTVSHPSGTIVFAPSTNGVTMKVGGSVAQELISSRTPITNLTFTNQAAAGKTPAAISFEFEAGGRHVGPTIRYVR